MKAAATVAFWFAVALAGRLYAGEEAAKPTFQQARRLESEGKLAEAFRAYLALPGAEHGAARLARPRAKAFLATLEKDKSIEARRPRAILVRGDLLLAMGDKEGALKCYRDVVASIGTEAAHVWQGGFMPRDYYPVEPPRPEHVSHEARPFSLGPGSHRDNWLIRRFVALEAWDDAAREFERIWTLHRRQAAKGQFKGLGLQFAIDYAYFLKRRRQADKALDVLREPLLRVNMDRNPNLAGPHVRRFAFSHGYLAGVSRKEFIRIAYGAFKTAAKENALVEALLKQIESGDNRARRVLARVRMHQGNVEGALALELAYLQAAKFDALTSAYRRSLAYEDCQKLAEAAAGLEKALELPYVPPKLPDKDEEAVQRQMWSQAIRVQPDPKSARGRAQFQAEALARLSRLYAALGQTDNVLDVALRQFDANPSLLLHLDSLERSMRRFRAGGKEARFRKWAEGRVARLEDPSARANLHWLLGDHAQTAKALGQAARHGRHAYAYSQWKERFRKAGKDKLRLLLRALIEGNPKDAKSRLDLLDLEDRFHGDEVVQALETLLDGDASYAFASGKGVYNRTQFRNYFDLAYRLLRLYERRGQLDKLRALGLRIAQGGKPFNMIRQKDPSQYEYRNENNLPEDINTCLALAIHHADAPALAALDKALAPTPQRPAKAQLARRKAGGWKPTTRRPFGWANLPDGVSALACNENVLSLALDDKHIYAGMPWGVAIYTHRGQPVTRVALAAAARDLLAHGGRLWVATPRGLHRIAIGSWKVAYLNLSHNLPRHYEGRRLGAHTLAADGDFIWIGTGRGIQRLDTRSNTLRIYSKEELCGHDDVGSRFLFERDYVWASGKQVSLRYNRASDAWTAISYREKPVGLMARADGVLWGYVWLNKELRDRPCRIDPETLKVTPVLIEGSLSSGDRSIDGPFACYGTWKGNPVLGASAWRPFHYDPKIGKLRRFPQSADGRRPEFDTDLLPGLRGGKPWRKPSGVVACYHNDTHHHEPLPGFRFYARRWVMARLPDGSVVLGGCRSRSPGYGGDARREWPEAYETWDADGGLYLISPDRKSVRRISAVVASDTLPGDVAFQPVFCTAHNHWVCTSRGVAALSEEGGALAHFTRGDGLIANRVVAGTELRGKVYFATGWGDHAGGLAVYDPKTSVFAALGQSDGLSTDKLRGVEVTGRRLRLTYDVEYGRGGKYRYRQFPPSVLDPTTGAYAGDARPRFMRDGEARPRMRAGWKTARPMPYVGGFVTAEREHKGRRYLCGTRGLVVLRRGTPAPGLATEELKPKVVLDPAVGLRKAAAAVPMSIASPDDLTRCLKHENPFVAARALAALVKQRRDLTEYLPVVAAQCQHPNLRVRSTALYVLTRGNNDAVTVPAFRKCLGDNDRYIRAVATIHLARRGIVPDEKHLRPILRTQHSFGNFPFGPDSFTGGQASKQRLYQALAPYATPELFRLFMDYPIPADDYEPRRAILKSLGKSLLRHPGAADVLLKAYDHDPHSWGQMRFAQGVFRHAGKPILPTLHKALASPDRVVRSNAARACGAIGDPSSIPRLITALGLESGLSRASIVWALGELKAIEALPHLARLYVDARNDEKRRRGAGFRGAQSQAEIRAHYDSIRNIDAVGTEWNELKAAAAPKPVDPRRNEELLRPRHVLDAVGRIGPAAAQGFYRALAGEKDAEGRCEAAIHLAEGGKDDLQKNLPILRNLLADPEAAVRIRAAVSLLILGQELAQRPILEWLASPNDWEKLHTLKQLQRVRDASLLQFARRPIETIARDPTANRYAREAARQIASASLRK